MRWGEGPYFKDRTDAGRQLAAGLSGIPLRDPVVLALPRGGVPVAVEIARALEAPLDLLLVRKIGAPGHAEFAVGAVLDGHPPERIIDDAAVHYAGASSAYIEAESERQLAIIAQRRELYQTGRAPLDLAGKDVVVVDDGMATGSTMRVALRGIRNRRAATITLAVPVAPAELARRLATEVDHIVCLHEPEEFRSVGEHYGDFRQVTDEEVVACLQAGAQPERGTPSSRSTS